LIKLKRTQLKKV